MDRFYDSKRTLGKDAYGVWLKGFLPKLAGHPIEGRFLNELGRLNGADYSEALTYFTKATKSAASDNWDLERQQTWQEIARLHEKNRQYRKALAALNNWKIEEPCGTGAGSSRVEKTFWTYRLSVHLEKPKVVRARMWSTLSSGKLYPWDGYDHLAKRVISMYGKDELQLLTEDLNRAQSHLEKNFKTMEYGKSAKELIEGLGKAIKLKIEKKASK